MPLVVEDMFAKIDAMDLKGFSRHLAQDVVFQFGNAPALRGREAVEEAIAGFFSSLAALRHELTGKWVAGNVTVLRFMTYYVRHGRPEVSVPCAVILQRDPSGLIGDYRIYIDLSPVFADVPLAA
ncbi:nuclear transport factor 2 family protein [Cupriavidus necator]|uniref:Nuclear transport factor 2 family protein n=1 Tax=Cupriavidus necator TaxID=106590 RepID=A0A1U9UPK1_CUPNE|nr:nuclear transport factor 2 family protein [Cupriavidus necator]AQV94161.1 nuclear transport factor 2 family protein [Cupriavidus necator]